MQELIVLWMHFFSSFAWQDCIKTVEPIKSGCGLIYELSGVNDLGQKLAIADMRTIPFAEPHYHAHNETEIYFVLQGTAVIVIGGKVHTVQKGDVLVTPPDTAHFTIPDKDFVLAVVNLPCFSLDNYIPVTQTDERVGFDREQFDRLTLGCMIQKSYKNKGSA